MSELWMFSSANEQIMKVFISRWESDGHFHLTMREPGSFSIFIRLRSLREFPSCSNGTLGHFWANTPFPIEFPPCSLVWQSVRLIFRLAHHHINNILPLPGPEGCQAFWAREIFLGHKTRWSSRLQYLLASIKVGASICTNSAYQTDLKNGRHLTSGGAILWQIVLRNCYHLLLSFPNIRSFCFLPAAKPSGLCFANVIVVGHLVACSCWC